MSRRTEIPIKVSGESYAIIRDYFRTLVTGLFSETMILVFVLGLGLIWLLFWLKKRKEKKHIYFKYILLKNAFIVVKLDFMKKCTVNYCHASLPFA